MARIVNAQYSTVIGTPEDIRRWLDLMRGGASIVNLGFSNFVLLTRPVTEKQLAKALESTPRKQRV